jgi:hypothetical protein
VIVVARYNALYIRHAAVANFNCVAVEYFVQTTCRWEVFMARSCRKFRAMLVLTDLLNGGLKQIMCLWRLRFVDGGVVHGILNK